MAVSCEPGNTYDGKLGARISSIFVIFFTSLLAAWLPVYAAGRRDGKKMRLVFFLAKYFGSGVIIGTALIHVSHPLPLEVDGPPESTLKQQLVKAQDRNGNG